MRNRYAVVLALAGVCLASGAQAGPPERAVRLLGDDWVNRPSGHAVDACRPASTDIPDGQVVLTCRVGSSGRLERCSVRTDGDPRLEAWGRCLSEKFRARPKFAGELVEVPIRFTNGE